MSSTTNLVLLFNEWLDEDDVNKVMKVLLPLENQKLNPNKNAFKHIDNYDVGVSRYLENTVIIGALYNCNIDTLKETIKIIKSKYNLIVLMSDDYSEWDKLN